MSNQVQIDGAPDNLEQLKKSINRTSNWRERLAAVEELGQWKSRQSIQLLTQRLKDDLVYPIQEAAYRQLRQLGEDVPAPVRKQGNLIEGLTKILIRVKKSLPKDHTYEDFKQKLKKMRLDIYDTYEGDKGDEFDVWLEGVWSSLRIR